MLLDIKGIRQVSLPRRYQMRKELKIYCSISIGIMCNSILHINTRIIQKFSMLILCNFISICTQSIAYGRNKRAEKHNSNFTARIRTLSVSRPKLSGRVMLASLSFLVSILYYSKLFINKTYQNNTCTWKHVVLSFCLVRGFLIKTSFFFFLIIIILHETRN